MKGTNSNVQVWVFKLDISSRRHCFTLKVLRVNRKMNHSLLNLIVKIEQKSLFTEYVFVRGYQFSKYSDLQGSLAGKTWWKSAASKPLKITEKLHIITPIVRQFINAITPLRCSQRQPRTGKTIKSSNPPRRAANTACGSQFHTCDSDPPNRIN